MSQTPALGRRREAVSSLKPNHRVSLCNLVKHVPSGQIELRVQFLPSACVCAGLHVHAHTGGGWEVCNLDNCTRPARVPSISLHTLLLCPCALTPPPPLLPRGLTAKASSVAHSFAPLLCRRSKITTSAPLV